MLDEKHTFHPYGAWLCLYFVATTISPLRGYDQSGLTVGSGAMPTPFHAHKRWAEKRCPPYD